MALQWKVLGTQFDDSLYHAILKLEAPKPNDRLNGLLVQVEAAVFNFTIGVGVDLVAGDKPAQDAVMRRMGFRSEMLALEHGPESDALGQKEFGFIDRIRTALKNHKGSTDLNAIMKERADAARAKLRTLRTEREKLAGEPARRPDSGRSWRIRRPVS